MNLVDANVLLYAVNSDAPHHRSAVAWLDAALSGASSVGFSWIVLLAFTRLSTRAGLFPSPLTSSESLDRVDAWLACPAAVFLEPTARHAALVRQLLGDVGAADNLVNDAHLAALAIEHGAQIVSYDNDFSRFSGVEWSRPPDVS